jgi:hypothetical protein
MNNSSDSVLKTVSVSRTVFYTSLIFMLSPALLILSSQKWLEQLVGWFFMIGAFLMLVSWIAPASFLFSKRPELALAWLAGLRITGYSFKAWEQLSKRERLLITIQSVATFVVAAVGVILIISNLFTR